MGSYKREFSVTYSVMKVLCITLINCTSAMIKVYIASDLRESVVALNELIDKGSRL